MRRTVLVGMLAAAAALAMVPGAGATTQVRHDLRPGQLVRDHGLGAKVPPAGRFVYATALDTDGAQELGIATERDGTVVLSELGDEGDDGNALTEDIGGELAPVSSPGPCSDSAYDRAKLHFTDGTDKKFRWNSTFNWRFNNSSTPSEITQSNALTDLKQATTNITQVNTDCSGFADNVSATQNYAGTVDRGTNIAQSTDCQNGDGVSVAGFGVQDPERRLATTCVWGDKNPGGEWALATESDVRFDKDSHKWYTGSAPAGCTNRWSVEGVGTHERGHTYGLAHVSEDTHGNLTMSPDIEGPCKKPEATLGKGDILGLEAAY